MAKKVKKSQEPVASQIGFGFEVEYVAVQRNERGYDKPKETISLPIPNIGLSAGRFGDYTLYGRSNNIMWNTGEIGALFCGNRWKIPVTNLSTKGLYFIYLEL